MWQKLLQEFLFGGAIIALAIAVGITVSPVIGGVIATLPIRLGTTLFLGGVYQGKEFTQKMLEGSLLTYPATFLFIIALFVGIPRIGLLKSFALASILCIALTVLLFKLTGRL